MKSKKTLLLFGALAAVGICLAFAIYGVINQYLDLGTVYVAKKEIAAQTSIKKDQFTTEKRPKKNIPVGAVTSDKALEQLVGRLTRTVIVEGQTLQGALVSDAHNLREVNQNYSENYVTVTIPIDSSDVPIAEIHQNDVVSLIGVRKENALDGEKIVADYIAESVLVLDAIVDKSSSSGKLLVLVPREEAPVLQTNIVVGKVRVVLDPRKFSLKGAQ
ncbi:SAF domain-containing protein [Cohnella soli]|uniref:SAF domain-containing protein n=1 Tax=Cohnella soli TaxID=425005 RepID=A0ABW0HQX9_9BACL